MNINKKSKPKYDLENFRTWDNYDSDKKMLIIVEDAYCINCKEFHIPDKKGKCPYCKTQLRIIDYVEVPSGLESMGVELTEMQNTGEGAQW